MKIYVASSPRRARDLSSRLSSRITEPKIQFFFPEDIGISASSVEEMEKVDKICCRELFSSDILIAIYPFGMSVSVEIGRFLTFR